MKPQINVVIDLPDNFVTQVAEKMIELQGPIKKQKEIEAVYTVNQVAKLVEKDPVTIRNHIKAELLIASKPGKSYIITEQNLNKYIKSNGQ